ncbi:MAG TPA: FAD-dependent oxidoreductase, partial [Actinomycetota bacterium]|nr:FAD-dependent oxidoreductase [Actinomycetota bacterium]
AKTVIERELRKRYGADYQVLCAGSGAAGLQALEQIGARGEQVALVLADLRLPDMSGTELMARVHGLDPAAKRALLTGWGDRQVGDQLVRAAVLGQVDDWGLKPWQPGDEGFHQLVVGLLYEWAQLYRPGFQAVQVVGEQWSARAHAIRDLLARNKVPFGFLPADSEEGRALLERAGATAQQLPVVVTFDGLVLPDPSVAEVAEALSAPTRPAAAAYDVTVVGAGPAGLAAAMYGASEGLGTLVLEPEATGGQAGTSSMIRNYLGFPRGISGTELAYRAFHQALGFGADIVYGQRAVGLHVAGPDRVVTLGDGTEVTSRAVILATGVSWRRLGVPSLEALVGAGVFYGAATSEAVAMKDERVFVVGGGNSAGQAAVHLASYAAQVTMLVRGPSLAETMSDYLVRELEATANVTVRYNTEAVDGHGDGRLSGLTLEDRTSRATETVPATALFILIGAEPHTGWLPDTLRRDRWGFVITGTDLLQDGQPPAGWPLDRPPMPLETSLPGVFAAGDVRHGSTKRVPGAVGDGSVAIRLVHEHLTYR